MSYEQQHFDFDYPDADVPKDARAEPACCRICGRNYFYVEYVNKDGTLNREKNAAHESWRHYCSRACFVKGLYLTWAGGSKGIADRMFINICHINNITTDELLTNINELIELGRQDRKLNYAEFDKYRKEETA